MDHALFASMSPASTAAAADSTVHRAPAAEQAEEVDFADLQSQLTEYFQHAEELLKVEGKCPASLIHYSLILLIRRGQLCSISEQHPIRNLKTAIPFRHFCQEGNLTIITAQ